MTQEYLHHKLLINQQKFKPETGLRKKAHAKNRSIEQINSIVTTSPLLNRHEIDKRQTVKEIVSGYPFASKQKKLVESFYNSSIQNIVSDEDVEAYQSLKAKISRENSLKSHMRNREVTNMTDTKAKEPGPHARNNRQAVEVSMNNFVEKPGKSHKGVKKGSSTYISSRISRCIESMLECNDDGKMVLKPKYIPKTNDNRRSIEESLEAEKFTKADVNRSQLYYSTFKHNPVQLAPIQSSIGKFRSHLGIDKQLASTSFSLNNSTNLKNTLVSLA